MHDVSRCTEPEVSNIFICSKQVTTVTAIVFRRRYNDDDYGRHDRDKWYQPVIR